jgi:hypothetical protein
MHFDIPSDFPSVHPQIQDTQERSYESTKCTRYYYLCHRPYMAKLASKQYNNCPASLVLKTLTISPLV